MTKTCPRCGGEFRDAPGSGRARKYCRPNCGDQPFECMGCGTQATGYLGKLFCSKECRVRALTANNHDSQVQSVRGRKGGLVRGAQRLAAPSSYLKKAGGHIHRAVAESVLGRVLTPGETVHHEDRDKHNNEPENLIVFESQAQHARHHKLGHHNHQPCTCVGVRLKELL